MAEVDPLRPPVNFPNIVAIEFEISCRTFVTGWQGLGHRSGLDISLMTDEFCGDYVKIVRPLSPYGDEGDRNGNSLIAAVTDLEEEEDEVVLNIEKSKTSLARVEYHILLSPSYQVPVLHFFLRDLPPSDVPLVDRMREMVIPNAYKAQVGDIGVIGGVTLAEHPFTGASVFVVHPCMTATAMSEVSDGHSVAINEYLQLWLGIVGGSVGLSLPLDNSHGQTRSTP